MNQDINFSVPHTIYSTILHPAMDDRTVATQEGEGMRGQQNESNSEDDGLLEYAEQRILSLVIYLSIYRVGCSLESVCHHKPRNIAMNNEGQNSY